MNKYIFNLLIAIFIVSAIGCSDYLDYKPQGALTLDDLKTADKVNGLVTAAYSAIGNDMWEGPLTSMWAYGSVRSDDAYKGGGSVSDVGEFNNYEQYNLVTPTTIGIANTTWTRAYAAISRANLALRMLAAIDETSMPTKTIRIAECRFLRGHMYFLLKELWKYVPYIDETMSDEDIVKVSNRQYTNDQLWDKIAADFQYGVDNLPVSQTEVGRANKLSAEAYLAKTRLFQAYEQDENNSVVNINKDKLNEVVRLTTDIINSGKYDLMPDFGENFLYEYDNGKESIFAVQFSINDGTQIGRLSMSTSLNYSMASQYGCCWFHIPSQNMVNAFKTNSGLPLFDTFNQSDLKDADLVTNGSTVDPRIDHTVGIEGHPFKYDPSILYDHSWERISSLYGGFGNMKEEQPATSPAFKKVGPFFGSAKNIDIIRYADVLLWKAEALIELDRQSEALPLINQVRTRAQNSTLNTRFANGIAPSNYQISAYVDGVNVTWTKANARKALQWERRLEFAMEGPRFFDLVRWGIASETLNSYLTVEKTKRSYLGAALFTKGRDEYFPIPQTQIDLTKGILKQNSNY